MAGTVLAGQVNQLVLVQPTYSKFTGKKEEEKIRTITSILEAV